MAEESKKSDAVIDFTEVGKTETLAGIAMKILDRLEIERAEGMSEWTAVAERMDSMVSQKQESDLRAEESSSESSNTCKSELEEAFNQLEKQAVKMRQSIAWAIGAEKQLEQSVEKNKVQIETWRGRVVQAEHLNNSDLASQARDRAETYQLALVELENTLQEQKVAISALRRTLTETEIAVQKAYVTKTVLHAREQLAIARARAKEVINFFDSEAVSVYQKSEKLVQEKEAQAASIEFTLPILDEAMLSSPLAQAIQSLETTLETLKTLGAEHAEKQNTPDENT